MSRLRWVATLAAMVTTALLGVGSAGPEIVARAAVGGRVSTATGGVLPRSEWETVATAALAFYTKQTGITVAFPNALSGDQVTFEPYTGRPFDTLTLPDGTYAETFAEDQNGTPNPAGPAKGCLILSRPEDASRGVIAHEVFHCVQLAALGSGLALNSLTGDEGWAIEGEAAFAACRFTGGNEGDLEVQQDTEFYRHWINTPTLTLLARTKSKGGDFDGHTGVGFWATPTGRCQRPGTDSRGSCCQRAGGGV